jgi:hypothetical protein
MINQSDCGGRRLVHRKNGKLEIFVMPPIVVKSVARDWRDPMWLAPAEPFRDYLRA